MVLKSDNEFIVVLSVLATWRRFGAAKAQWLEEL
jgi:hypothetical protein